jgi:hypothetical protein
MVTAHFITNDITHVEIFVKDLPSNYQFAPNERLVTRQITEQEYALLTNDKYKNIKLYRYVNIPIADKTLVPKGVDYKIGLNTRLFEKAFVNNIGFLETMEYYGSSTYNPATKSWDFADLIIRENFSYTIDPWTKYVVARTKIITWFKEDGTAHPDYKIMFKPYTFLEMDEEAIRRRSNIITALKIELAKFASYVVQSQFPDPNNRPDSNEAIKRISAPLNTAIRSYIDAGDRDTLINLIDNSTEPFFSYTIPWLGITGKQLIKSRIS